MNIHGQNIKECSWTEHYQGYSCVNYVQNVYKLLLYKCTQNQFAVQKYTKLCANWLTFV